MRAPSSLLRGVTLVLVLLATALPVRAATLYDDLGGREGLVRIVDAAMARFLTDPRTRAQFDNINPDWLKPRLVDHFCELADGPCTYKGRDMHTAHKGLGVNTAEFNGLVECLQDAMDEVGVPFATQNRMLARLAPFYREVVTR
ncbi:group I truncated hemoglobin [Zavarzinia sp. CC-PAN008]|uniref:group I truncated hemoglobin n=1 Tax=Zavarzinia sp. CC-PAN008 TaxID=3243332 RepID=UPI003F747AA6